MFQPYLLFDVFTDAPFAGNQLAVFPDAQALSDEQMQRLASELNLAETTFVLDRSGGAPRVKIFTPEVELPFAGHPALGTAAAILGLGSGKEGAEGSQARLELDLAVGRVPIDLKWTSGGARCELAAPPAQEIDLDLDANSLAAELGLGRDAVDRDIGTACVSCGNAFVFVPLRSPTEVAAARIPHRVRPGILGVVAFARTGPTHVHARVFIPGSAVPEDPATGSANAPLAALLHARGLLPEGELLETSQGDEIGRPSRLWARLVRGADGVLRPLVSGDVVYMGRGELRVPEEAGGPSQLGAHCEGP